MIEYWRHSVAHPALTDWLNTAAYVAASALCAWAARRARKRQQRSERVFWWATCGILLLSGANEILDLQSLLTAFGRRAAQDEGWYAERRNVQLTFLAAFAGMLLAAALALLWQIRRLEAAVKLAFAGLVAIGAFAVLRAATFFHAVAFLVAAARRPVWINWTESAGLAAIALAAWLFGRNDRQTLGRELEPQTERKAELGK